MATNLTLYPNGDNSVAGWSKAGGTYYYENVNSVKATDSDWCAYKASGTILFNLTDPGVSSGAINYVNIFVQGSTNNGIGGQHIDGIIVTHGSEYNIDLGGFTNDFSSGDHIVSGTVQLTTNPNTGLAWTWQEIIDLIVGANVGATAGIVRVHCVQITVNYEASIDWTQNISHTISLADSLKKEPGKGLTASNALTDAIGKTDNKGVSDVVVPNDDPKSIVAINATNDDGRNTAPVTGADTWNNADLSVGQKNSAEDDKAMGLRFNGVAVPQGATITSAYILLVCKLTALAASKTADIYGGAYDNFGGFSNSALPEDAGTSPFDDIDLTTAHVQWAFPDLTAGMRYTTPDIKAVAQEIVSRVGWSSGNSMAFAIRPNYFAGQWSKDFYDYGTDASKAAILVITYRTGISKTIGKFTTASNTLADILAKQVTTIKSETITVADSQLKTYGKFLTQAITLADALKRDPQIARAETIALADNLGIQNQKRLTEILAVSDSLFKNATMVLAQILSVTNTAPIFTMGKFLTDGPAVADQGAKFQPEKALTEDLALSDQQGATSNKVLGENPAVSDALASITTFAKALAETLAVEANLSPQMIINKVISSNISILDNIIAGLSFSAVITDNFLVRDIKELFDYDDSNIEYDQFDIGYEYNDGPKITIGKNIFENATVADILVSLKEFYSNLIDGFQISDEIKNQVEKIITDNVSASSVISSFQTQRAIAEAIAISDILEFGAEKNITEIVNLIENLFFTAEKNINDGILVIEVINTQSEFNKNVSDDFLISDAIRTESNYNLHVLDSLSVAELLVKEYNKSILEALSMADSISTLETERLYKKTIILNEKRDKIVLLTKVNKNLLINKREKTILESNPK